MTNTWKVGSGTVLRSFKYCLENHYDNLQDIILEIDQNKELITPRMKEEMITLIENFIESNDRRLRPFSSDYTQLLEILKAEKE